MDSLRGNFSSYDEVDNGSAYELDEEETAVEPPPSPVGQDERRMHVRAYNHWASLLDNRSFPSVEDLEPENLPDFGPHSVLLDFTSGIENPAIQYLGAKLGRECGSDGPIATLSDVPSRSLLSRITDHYMQILANQAPIGFEAEFVNQRGATVLYRGILLPFSSDDDTIDFIYGVINWKELADQQTTDELLLEVDQALQAKPEVLREELPITDWADGPVDTHNLGDSDGVLDLELSDAELDWPEPDFGQGTDSEEYLAPVAPPFAAQELALDIPEYTPEFTPGFIDEASADYGLADTLAAAREMALAALGSEDRSRAALYAAIGKAYDFSIAAADEPEEFQELVSDSGLTMQDRAPMTPIVKLVFGAEYDKTRLTEYASALGHAHRLGLERGSLANFLSSAPGGLKGVINAERQAKRAESGKVPELRESPREALARKLRKIDHQPLDSVDPEGSEFTLLVARRLPDGQIVLLGEVADDIALLERAARRLIS